MEPDELTVDTTPILDEEPVVEAPPVIPTDEQMAAWAAQRNYVQREAPVVRPGDDPRIAERDRLLTAASTVYGEEQVALTRQAMQLTQDISVDLATQRMMPRIGQTYMPQLVSTLTDDAHEREYYTKAFKDATPDVVEGMLANPNTKDILSRAARDYKNERSTQRLTQESAYSEQQTVSSSEMKQAQEFERSIGAAPGSIANKEMILEAKRGLART